MPRYKNESPATCPVCGSTVMAGTRGTGTVRLCERHYNPPLTRCPGSKMPCVEQTTPTTRKRKATRAPD